MKYVNDARRTWLKLGFAATAMMGTLGRDAFAQGTAGGSRPTVLLSLVADELVMVGERPSYAEGVDQPAERLAHCSPPNAYECPVGRLRTSTTFTSRSCHRTIAVVAGVSG